MNDVETFRSLDATGACVWLLLSIARAKSHTLRPVVGVDRHVLVREVDSQHASLLAADAQVDVDLLDGVQEL